MEEYQRLSTRAASAAKDEGRSGKAQKRDQ
ncbi:hypothetical protein [Nitrobacter sp. Nb-311A]|nr:hypothetical protein [Nitrobacter sp. Nb-311A]